MKIIKLLSLSTIIAIIVFAIIKQNAIKEYLQPEQLTNNINLVHEYTNSVEQQAYYQGEVVNFEHGGGYTYIKVKGKTQLTFWIAVEIADVKKGDFVRFKKELVMQNFESKALNKTFDELMFASNLEYKVSE